MQTVLITDTGGSSGSGSSQGAAGFSISSAGYICCRDIYVVEALCITPCIVLTSSSESKENKKVTESCRQSKGPRD